MLPTDRQRAAGAARVSGVAVTDYRRTDQELWEEDAIADEDRRAEVVPKLGPTLPTGVYPRKDRGERAERITTAPPVPPPDAVESVARFIAEPDLVPASGSERTLDAPERSLAALWLLDGEELEEVTEPPQLLIEPLPPPPPAPAQSHVAPAAPAEPMRASRAEPSSERVLDIPKTHPLANSIAPGGSVLSTPPLARPRSLRWHVVACAGALLAIGAGTSRFLQSRGEHHGATGASGLAAPHAEGEGAGGARREVEPVTEPDLEAPSELAIARSEALAATQEEAAEGEVAGAPEEERARPSVEVEDEAESPTAAARGPSSAPGDVATPRPESGTQARVGMAQPAASQPLRVALGTVELRPRQDGAAEPAQLAGIERARMVAAMNALTERLRACVGDEHGVADVTLTVRAPGVVSHAVVEGTFAGSEKGSCIARALRKAELPHFSEPVLRIEYPFML